MKTFCLLIVCLFAVSATNLHANPRAEFEAQVGTAVAKLNREAANPEGALRLASLLQLEYGTPIQELRWAVENQLPWGEIVAFAYIHATNGRSFSEIREADASRDFWGYVGKAGMNSGKMVNSLEQFLKRVERERNSRMFDQMRATRAVSRIPDLGTGFGLFQEALDFRQIGATPVPTKVHAVGAVLAKGEK
jgi:hypothetical protein